MAKALEVPVIQEAVYPYTEAPPLDVVMSYIIGSSIQWGFDPRITSSALSETSYFFLRVTCHSLWPISHLHTIPLERYVFLYAFMSGASISFPHLFLCSLNEVHRSSVVGHALIHPIFIHRILLFLDVADFPSCEPVQVVALLGATFLRQRAAHLRVNPLCLKVHLLVLFPLLPLRQVLMLLRGLMLLLMLMFLHRLLQMIQTFDVRWIMS